MTPAAVAQRAATLPGDTIVYIPGVGETTLEDLRGMAVPESTDRRKVGPFFVLQAVAKRWNVRPESLASKRRSSDVMQPRQVAMYVMKEMMKMSLVQIGNEFGGRDHSTVIYSIRQVEKRMEESQTFRTVVGRVCAEVGLAMRGEQA